MAIAVARIQEAIDRCRGDKVSVTIIRIAQHLNQPRDKVASYVLRMRHLKEQLSPERGLDGIVGRYERAIIRLQKKSLMITYSRIARHANSHTRLVKNWCSRNPNKFHGAIISREVELRDHRVERRIFWLKKARMCTTTKLTKTEMARIVGVDRCSLNRILRRIEKRKSRASMKELVGSSRG